MGKVFVFIAIEIFLLVTPMMWPTIPFRLGLFAYGVAAIFAVLAVVMLLMERVSNTSRATQELRVHLPDPLYGTVTRDGRPYDRGRLSIDNPAPNLAVEDVQVKLISIAAARGRKTAVNKYLTFEDGDLDVASIAAGSSRNLILFESERRPSKTSPKVAAPKLCFGPFRSRNRYVEMPPGRYVATIRIEGSRVKPSDWQFEVLLNRHNSLYFRRAKRSHK